MHRILPVLLPNAYSRRVLQIRREIARFNGALESAARVNLSNFISSTASCVRFPREIRLTAFSPRDRGNSAREISREIRMIPGISYLLVSANRRRARISEERLR